MPGKKDAIRKIFEEVSLGAPENAVGFVMWRLTMRYQREVDRALEPCNLTNLQFITLAQVAWFGREDKPATQIELARGSGIHPMQVSQTLKALELKKMIARRRSSSDTRAKRVEMTTPGLNTLRAALPRVIAVQHRIFGKEGRPGGALLKGLLRLDSNLVEDPPQHAGSSPAVEGGNGRRASRQE